MNSKENLIPLTAEKKEQLQTLLYSRLIKFVGYLNNEETKKLVAIEVNKVCYELGVVIH